MNFCFDTILGNRWEQGDCRRLSTIRVSGEFSASIDTLRVLKKQKRILAGVKTALSSGFGRQVIEVETNFISISFFASNLILYLYDRFFQANNKN